MEKKKLLGVGIGLLVLLLVSMPAFAFSPNIENGISWLTTSQNAEGYWGSNADFAPFDTSTVLDTLKALNIGTPAYANGVTWLSSQSPLSTDFISRKVTTLSAAGVDVSSDLSLLINIRSLDGGWGGDADSTGAINDTALALQALKAAAYSDQSVISTALGFLLATQNSDGGWGFYPAACPTCQANPSNCYMTALVSATLQQFAPTTALVAAINKATGYLVAHQNSDGGFGSSESTIYETALAYIALVGVTTDETILGKAVNHLTSTQLTDGSWLADPYATALAIKALYLAANKPQPPTPPDKGTATGKVIDSTTNALLKDVSVTLESNAGISTLTDQTGTFTLANCPPGAQKILFSLPGYAGGSASLIIVAGSIVDLGNIPLTPNPSFGMVKGIVTEAATGNPLAGVVIDMTGSTTATATTGADGAFSFIDVAPGAVTLTASKPGYYAITGSGNVVAGGALFFNPQLPTTPPAVTTGSLIGRVFDASTDQPIQGASIALASGPSTATNSNGAFAITEIAPNTYQVTIAAPGYGAQVYQVMIVAGVVIDMQTIYLTPSAQSTTITGKVTEADTGKAIAGATVTVAEVGAAVMTAADGGYVITGIGLLEFTVAAAATGYNTGTVPIKTSAYGQYSVDITLVPSQASDVHILSVLTDRQEYGVNSPVQITTTLANNGANPTEAFATAEVIDEYGNLVAIILRSEFPVEIPAGGSGQAALTWNTAQSPARGYKIIVHVFRSADAMLLAEGYTIFAIKPDIQVDATNLVVTPQFTHVKKTETVVVAVWITNWSNIDASLTAAYEVRDPQNTVIQSGSTAFSIPAFEFSRKIDVGSFEKNFSASGQYPVTINILSQGNIIATGGALIHVAPAIRIEPSKTLKPDKVLPDGDKRIKNEIKIEGVEDKP